MSLTDTAIRSAKPTTKPQKLFDGRGLFLLITPSGSKLWRAKFFHNRREQLLSLGRYPDVSLADARKHRDELRKQLAEGQDPAAARKASRRLGLLGTETTFQSVALEWYEQRKANWVPDHANRLLSRLTTHVFPWIGSRPIAEITAVDLLPVLRRIQERGAIETAHRALNSCSQILRFAVATGRATRDITTDLRGALPPHRVRHRAATVDPKHLAPLLRKLLNYPGGLVVRSAIHFGLLTFTRPGELRKARWSDIDLENRAWSFTASKTKARHVVALCTQAIEILTTLRPLTGDSEYIFPCARSNAKPMSNNAVLAAMRSMHISKEELCGNGFRVIARTLICEELGFRAELIEHQLAHTVRDALGRAYNRTQFLTERRSMMQKWGDYIDQITADNVHHISIARYA